MLSLLSFWKKKEAKKNQFRSVHRLAASRELQPQAAYDFFWLPFLFPKKR